MHRQQFFKGNGKKYIIKNQLRHFKNESTFQNNPYKVLHPPLNLRFFSHFFSIQKMAMIKSKSKPQYID